MLQGYKQQQPDTLQFTITAWFFGSSLTFLISMLLNPRFIALDSVSFLFLQLLPFKVLKFNIVAQDADELLECRRLLVVPKQLFLRCLRGQDTIARDGITRKKETRRDRRYET